MMISYLVIGFSRQTIVDYNTADLLDLIRLAFASKRLKVKNFGDAGAEEYMVTAHYAYLKSEKLEKLHHSGKWDIGVRVSPQNPFEQFVSARHRGTRGERLPQE